jgi:SAM-dependent methyltransferase
LGAGWFLDELAAAGPEHLDPGYVAGYDRKSAFDPVPDIEILQSLGLGAETTLIDLGAGTGTFAVAAAPLCRRVIAVDVSRAMLDALEVKVREAGLANVEIVRAGLLSYEGRERVDFVYSKNTLHHLPDLWKGVALDRLVHQMKPGGILRLRDLVYSFEPSEAGAMFEAWLGEAPADPAAGWTRAELETHIRTEYSTYSWLLEPMLTHAGFDILDATFTESKVFAAYTCRRRSP